MGQQCSLHCLVVGAGRDDGRLYNHEAFQRTPPNRSGGLRSQEAFFSFGPLVCSATLASLAEGLWTGAVGVDGLTTFLLFSEFLIVWTAYTDGKE